MKSEVEAARAVLESLFDAETALLFDSGRSALQLAIELALFDRQQRVVALPAFQCVEVAAAAIGARSRITLYDIDPETLGPDLHSLERALNDGASAVVVAPLYGIPVEWDELIRVANRFGADVIEDAAQANGAAWHLKPFGTLGEISVLSFGRGKGWGGGGGALLLRGGRWRERASRLPTDPPRRASAALDAFAAMSRWVLARPSLYGIPSSIPWLGLGETNYEAPRSPEGISLFAAALLRGTREAAIRESSIRKANARWWLSELPSPLIEGVPVVKATNEAGYLRFPIRVRHRAVFGERERRLGIMPSYPVTLADLPPVAMRLTHPGGKRPGAACLVRELTTLPTHSLLTNRDRHAIRDLAASWR